MSQSNLCQYSLLQKYSFHFPNLPSRLECIICHSILKNSKQTSCGCKVCEKCIKDYLSNGPKPCPNNQPDCVDRLTMEDINQDNATNREIGNLTVNCPFESCTFSSTLKNMVEHIDKCEFREIECEQCKERIKKTNREKHDKDSCVMRNVKCKYCNEEMTFKDLNSVHLNPNSDKLCSKYKSICPNNCHIKEKVPLKKHLKICTNMKLECPFRFFECQIEKMSKEHLITHLEKESISHSSSLINKIKHIAEQIDNLNSEIEKFKKINEEHRQIHEISSDSNNTLEQSIDHSRIEMVPLMETNNEKEIIRNGNFFWKVNDFNSRRLEGKSSGRVSLTSDPFYTSECGYQMCLRIYPAGDGVGKGSYLSVFFAIMKGEFDDLLPWPFKQKVTLTIFDLESRTKNHSETFKPDTRSICYQKPTDECNIASGSPRFISLSQLSNNSIYCKNDIIFIKISVDKTGLSES